MGRSKNLKSEVSHSLDESELALQLGDRLKAWTKLTDAHILSQSDAFMHSRVHLRMLILAWSEKNFSEIWGQVLRLLVAAPESLLESYPVWNTGRSNVSMLEPMEIPARLEEKMYLLQKT